jgi:hypothetical protein
MKLLTDVEDAHKDSLGQSWLPTKGDPPSLSLTPSAESGDSQSTPSQFTSGRGAVKIAVIGPPGDSERRRSLIGWGERSDCAVEFEFREMDAGKLPKNADGGFYCGMPLPEEQRGSKGGRWLTIAFSPEHNADVTVDLRTGEGIGLALAAVVSSAKGREKFEFFDGGVKLKLTRDDMEWA